MSLKPSRARNGLIRRLSPPHGSACALGLEIFPARLDLQLQRDEFIQRQPPPRDFHIGQFLGEMNHVNRVGARRKRSGVSAERRQLFVETARIREVAALCRGAASNFSSVRQINPRSQRCGRPSVSGYTGAMRLMWMKLSSPPSMTSVSGWSIVRGLVSLSLPKDEHLVADRKILFHERQVPPAAMQPRRAVVENDFKNGFAAAAKTFEAERDDRAARRGRFVLRQFGDFAEMPAVFVTPRPVQQQILDGENVQPRQLRRAFRADAPERTSRAF